MKIKNKFLSIVLVLVILFGSFNFGFAVNLDNITEYNMELSLDTKEHIVKGKQETKFTNTYSKELRDIVFHLYPDSYKSYETLPSIGGNFFPEGETPKLAEENKGYINIEKVYINDEEAQYTDSDQILKINLTDSLKKGEEVNIKIEYSLKVPEGYHRFHHQDGIYSLTNWYPILSIYDEETNKWDENPYHPIGESNYSDVSNYNVKITVPKNMVVAPTGTIVEEIDNDKGKTVDIKAGKVRDFVIIMGEKYKVETKEVDGIKISSYYIEADSRSKENQNIILNEVASAVEFMNKTVGKYPYDELKIVETYLSGGAMEYPQLLQMGRYGDMWEIDLSESAPFTLEAAVHETIHQWWYVVVGNNEFKEPFLDESLTVFTTAYYFQEKYGQDHNNGINYAIRMGLHPSGIKPIGGAVDEFDQWMDYSESIYQRGPAFFEDLRQRVGEEKFIEILQTYFTEYQFKNATIEGLLHIIGNIAGKDIKKIMTNAITEPNYHPKDIELTEEEQKEFYKERRIKQIKESEKRNGTVIGSIILKGLEDDELIVVNQEAIELEENLTGMNNVNEILKEILAIEYDIQVKFLEEKDLTNENKEGNLILIGNHRIDGFLKEISSDLGIKISEDVINVDGVSIENENIGGVFITENPKNKENLILVIFSDKDTQSTEEFYIDSSINYIYEIMYNYDDQFIINPNKIEIRGQYK